VASALWNFRISYVMASSAQVAPAIPDEEIVRRFQETGSSDCFAELFARHRKRVYMACRGFFADSAAAEDATQETFLRTYQKIHSFQGGNFSGWLMRIAKNVCIDQWRKRRPETGIDDAPLPEGSAVGAPERTPDLHLMVEEVWKEMTFLPPDQRLCLEMKIQGYSYEETATRTGLSIEAVKSHLQNGRRRLWLKIKGIGQQR
jgi:RNA polymerase sigma factor (sigma-70 family)